MTDTVLDYTEEIITPELAKAYLALNTFNRKEKAAKIEEYVRDMQAEDWAMTGEGLKFSPSGRLLDGQNRLMAVIEAGAPVRMTVVRGVLESAMAKMDSGKPRSRADALFLAGVTHNPTKAQDLAAAVVAHRAWTSGWVVNANSRTGKTGPTNTETINYALDHPGLAAATEFGRSMYHHLRLPAGAWAVAKMTLDAINSEAASDFFDRIATMHTSGKGDPIATLFRRVAQEREKGRKTYPLGLALFFIFRAWNAYRDEEPLSKFQVGSAQSGWGEVPAPL